MSTKKATKYHITKKGTIGVCEAEERACQYGASEHLSPNAVARIATGNPHGEKETAIWFNQQTIKEDVGAEETLETHNVAFPELVEPKTSRFIPTDLNKEYNMDKIKDILKQHGIEKPDKKLAGNLYFTAFESDDLYNSFDEKAKALTVQIYRDADIDKEEAAEAAHMIAEHGEVPNRHFDVAAYIKDGQNYNTIISKTSQNSLTPEQVEDINQIIKNTKAPVSDLGNENAHRPIYDYLLQNRTRNSSEAYKLTDEILEKTKVDRFILAEINEAQYAKNNPFRF